jgi:two-component system LytT family sensor kinase
MLSRSFYWKVAFISAVAAAVVFSLATLFRLGPRPEIFAREFLFGFLFSMTVWWYNLSGFPAIEQRFLHAMASHRQLLHIVRIGTTLLFSYFMIWFDERIQWLHIDWDLEGFVFPEYANEFRALITSGIILLIVFLLDTARRFYGARMENEHLKLENSVAQFEMLKQQINPHFLFNSLNILKTLVKAKDDKAEEYVLRLSDLYRSLLQSNQRDKVLLSEELSALDNYLFMLNTRFDNKLQVVKHITATNSSYVPPFTLQMLVENCIKHNVISDDKPLLIELLEEPGYIVVRNNLQPKRSVEDSSRLGLNNINQRYRALAGKDIEIEKTDTHFIVRLPRITT